MKPKNDSTNPMALNLEAIRQSKSNVTLGFKCPPDLKLTLAEQAIKKNIPLSKLVLDLIVNANKISDKNIQMGLELTNLINSNKQKSEKNIQMGLELTNLTNSNNQKSEKISFYENSQLQKLYEEYKFKTVKLKDNSNKEIEVYIAEIKDVFTVLINSFKI